ncbi:Acyl-CoA transferase [Azospirillaceae bacterium]
MSGTSVRERALSGLLTALTRVPGARVAREIAVPTDVPLAGLLILRDGDPGEPEETFSPHTYHYEHVAQLEAIVQSGQSASRAVSLDGLLYAIGRVLEEDRTLGDAVEWLEWSAPRTEDLAIPAGAAIKGAIVTVVLMYSTENPLC